MSQVLLERENELAAIDETLAAARAGAGALVVVEGPAGIGKSSIVGEGCRRAADAGMAVLQARGSELESAFSWGVVRQLFEKLLVQVGETGRERLLAGAAAHAARLFEPVRLTDPAPASEAEEFAFLHGLYWLTANLADTRPLLIALDDAQWADAASQRWISYLSRRLDSLAVCVIAATRRLAVEDRLLLELAAHPATMVLRPAMLTPEAVTELVRAGLGAGADAEFCLGCRRATGGNPLLVRELVRSLAAEGLEPTAQSVTLLDHLAPQAVARSVAVRLSRVAPEAAAVARVLAVLGDDADARIVAGLARIDPRQLAPAAAGLARVDLLLPGSRLRFTHPLVRNAVYETIPAHERAHEHARAAAALAAAGSAVELVAAQLLRAPAESLEDAAAVLRDAARHAAGAGAPESAARYLRRALEEPLADEERAEVLLELVGFEYAQGPPTAIDGAQEAVTLLRDPERRRIAWLDLGRVLAWSDRAEDAAQAFERGLDERADLHDDLRRRLEAESIAVSIRLPARHVEAYQRLDSLAIDPADGPGAGMLLGLQAFHDAALGRRRDRAVARAQEAIAAVQPGLPGEERAFAYALPFYVLLFADRLDQGIRLLDGEIANERERGNVFGFSGALLVRATFAWVRGAVSEAEADARAAFDVLPRHDLAEQPHFHAWFVQILVERGAVDEAADLLTRIEQRIGAGPHTTTWHMHLLRARSVVASARGDHAAALADSLAVGRILTEVGSVNPALSYPGWRSAAALSRHALGEAGEALELAREELELARAWGAPRTLGRALRVTGLIEGGSAGIDLLQQAIDVLEGSPAGLEHAHALVDYGSALRRANHRTAAREQLRRGLEAAQRAGAGLLAARAHEELLATGARPRRLELTGTDALTPSERRVAAMAGEGHSNKEIAQSLFVTSRTVEMHLSHTFRKLGVISRTQLAAALAADHAATITSPASPTSRVS